jgi:hypothetical protein
VKIEGDARINSQFSLIADFSSSEKTNKLLIDVPVAFKHSYGVDLRCTELQGFSNGDQYAMQ